MRPSSRLLPLSLLVGVDAAAATLQAPGVYGSIQGAIDASSPGDLIDIQGGAYDEALVIPHELTLQGDAKLRTELLLTPTTSVGTEGAIHVLPGVPLALSRLDVRAGATRGVYAEAGSSVTMADVALRDSAGEQGGGAWVEGTLVANGLVVENTSAIAGGGLWVQGELQCTDCAFQGTSATDRGGAIWHSGGDLVLVDTTIADALAFRGRALYDEGTSATITRMVSCDDAYGAYALELWGPVGSITASAFYGSPTSAAILVGLPAGGDWTLDHLTIWGNAYGLFLFDARPNPSAGATGHTGLGDTASSAGTATVTNTLVVDALDGNELISDGEDWTLDHLTNDYNAFAPAAATRAIAPVPRGPHSLSGITVGYPDEQRPITPERCTIDAFLPPYASPTIDAGTGYDPDGSVADIGATGGPDTWPHLHADADADGYTVAKECDDDDAMAYPGGVEVCDGHDNDCDGLTDDDDDDTIDVPYWYMDLDGDLYGNGAAPAGGGHHSCEAPPPLDDGFGYLTYWVPDGNDCDDTDPTIHPGAPEDCDPIDRDCDSSPDFGAADATRWWPDLDDDGHGDATIAPLLSCSTPGPTWVANIGDDCDDGNDAIHPGLTETCDGVDQNCTGNEDDATDMGLWYPDADGDGYPDAALEVAACTAPEGYVAPRPDGEVDCDDTEALAFPGNPEVCDGIDNDCNQVADDLSDTPPTWHADDDQDGFGNLDPRAAITTDCPPAGFVADASDCDDTNDTVHPDATEVCDGIDNDCSGQIDDGPTTTWYVDADGDGWGSTEVQASCRPDGVVERGGDCQDAFADIHPEAEEIPGNNVDEDCADGPARPPSTPKGEPAASGCQCSSGSSTGTGPLWLGVLPLAMLRRRRAALAALGLAACATEPAPDRLPEAPTRFPSLEEAAAAAPWFAVDQPSGPALLQRASRATFRAAEPGVIELHHRAGPAPVTATLSLVGVGRDALAPAPPATPPEARGRRVVLERGSIVEWYVNGPEGIEQGFTLRERPDGHAPLRMALALEGLHPEARGHALTFVDDQGQPRFRYDHLAVTDRDHTPVPAHLAADCDEPSARCQVVLVIDDAEASYPLYVDPLLAELVTTIDPVDAIDNLGAAVALDGDRAVVSAPAGTQGRVFILERNVGNPDAWGIEHTLFDSTDSFGESLAFDYPYLAVGAPASDTVKVFVDDGGWTELQTETGPAGSRFGEAVELQLSYLLIGAPDDGPGSVWVGVIVGSTFDIAPTSLTAASSVSGDRFGASIGLLPPNLLIGAPGTSGGDGAAFLFDGDIQEVQRIDGAPGSAEALGSAIATSTARVAIGAPGSERVLVYDVSTNQGDLLIPAATPELSAPPQSNAGFGASVALTNDTLVVGDAGVGAASVHHFALEEDIWFHAQSTSVSAENNGAPVAVAVSPRSVLGGAPGGGTKGAAALWERSASALVRAAILEDADKQSVNAGRAVAIEGDLAAVGDESAATLYGGRVTLFRRNGDTWSSEIILSASVGGGTTGEFGHGVAIDSGIVVVGAPGDDLAFVYTKDAGVWSAQELVDPDPADGRFGSSVAIDAPIIAVGDPSGRGQVQLFHLDGARQPGPATATITSDPDGYAVTPVVQLGASVAVDGNRVAIGGPGWDAATGIFNAGKVEIYDVDVSGENPVFIQRIEGTDADDRCGKSLDLDGDRLAIGCPNNGAAGLPGKALLYRGGLGGYALEKEVLGASQDNHFGTATAVEDDRWFVGAKGLSKVRMYQRNTDGEDQWGELLLFDGPNNSNFGADLDVDGNQVLIGAPKDGDASGGSAHLFDLDATIPPTLYDDLFYVNEDDVNVPLTVTLNDIAASIDPLDDADAITTNGPANATLTKVGSQLLFTPDANVYGTQTFEYTVPGALTYATVTVEVLPINDLPVAVDDAYTTVEETLLTATSVLDNDADVESPLLTASLVSGPSHAATFALDPDGTFQYEGAVDYFGTDTFTYEAVDNEGAHSAPATVTITVTDAPESPILTDSSWTTERDTPLLVPAPGLAGPDWAELPSTDTFFAIADASALAGTATVLPNGGFSFVPDTGFVGTTSFLVQADNGGAIGTATVTIDVIDANHPPEPQPDSYQVAEDRPLTVPMNGVLANDADPDGDTLQATFDAPSMGTLVQADPSGTFTWSPPPDFHGVASLSYLVSDGIEVVGPVTVDITVEPVNDAPFAVDDAYQVEGPGPHAISPTQGLLANDGDVDGDPLTAALLRAPDEGTVTVEPDGAFTFTPRAGAEGAQRFDYLVSDGLATAKATVEITVHDNPVPVPEDSAHTGAAATGDTGAPCDDHFFPDRDGDGYAEGTSEAVVACEAPAGFTDKVGDCDDSRADRYPGAPETQGDGIDQDCDGSDADITPAGACQTAPSGLPLAFLLLVPLARRRRTPVEVRR